MASLVEFCIVRGEPLAATIVGAITARPEFLKAAFVVCEP